MLVVMTGCSWALVTPPPRYDTGARPLACTAAWTAPFADTVVAAGLVAGGLAAAGEGLSPAVLIAALLAAVPYGFSAWYGYPRVDRCRRLNARNAAITPQAAIWSRNVRAWPAQSLPVSSSR